MRDFIDKTSEENGTPINRDYLMAIQGFDAVVTDINEDGNVIVETNSQGHTLTTTINEDGSITEVFHGIKTINKKTIIRDNGQIVEEIY